jgi:ketol-acid reductoisomerase
MAKRYYEKDGNLAPPGQDGRHYRLWKPGPRARPQPARFGRDVVVGLYPGKELAKAEAAGLRVLTFAEAAKAADVIMILVPDHIQGDLYNNEIAPSMTPGKTLMFAHGFNIHFGQITPPAGRRFDDRAQGAGPPRPRTVHRRRRRARLVAVHQNASGQALENALAYAWRSAA